MMTMKGSKNEVYCVERGIKNEDLDKIVTNYGLQPGELQEIKG